MPKLTDRGDPRVEDCLREIDSYDELALTDEFGEDRPIRGILTGLLAGAAAWGAILFAIFRH